MPRRLLSQPLLGQVHRLLAPHGVAAFNFYGDSDGPPARAFAARLHAEFGHVRYSTVFSRFPSSGPWCWYLPVSILFHWIISLFHTFLICGCPISETVCMFYALLFLCRIDCLAVPATGALR